MGKKITIIIIVLITVGVMSFLYYPLGEYVSNLEKSSVEKEITKDSSGKEIPTLSLITGDYSIESGDSIQAELLFDVDGLKKTKGAFKKFKIEFNIAEDFTKSKLKVEIQSATINTGNRMRDKHLLKEEFFNVKKHPLITFVSNQISITDSGYIAKGDLTLLATEKKINVPFKHLGNGTDKKGIKFEAFEGNFAFDRIEYGMQEESGTGNIVTISFYCELIKN